MTAEYLYITEDNTLSGELLKPVYFYKITHSNQKVTYGYYDDHIKHLLIPISEIYEEDSRHVYSRKADEEFVKNLLNAKRKMIEHNAKQINGQTNMLEIYRQLGSEFTWDHTRPPYPGISTSSLGFKQFFMSVGLTGVGSHKIGINQTLSQISGRLNWKIEPATRQEIEELNQVK